MVPRKWCRNYQHVMKGNLSLLKDLLEPYMYMTSKSKNVYIDKLDDTVNEYHNTYHSTVKMKPADVKSSTYIDLAIKNANKIRNMKLMIM